jgi:hypothetical protein
MQTLYRCEAGGRNLNSTRFSNVLKPGYCLAMTISWAKAALVTPGVASLYKPLMQDFAFWNIIQTNYEINKSSEKDAALRAVKTLEANGLKLLGDRPGQIELQGAFFNFVDQVLVDAEGTFLLLISGAPGKGAHFLGWRRVGTPPNLVLEFFDPNYGCLAAQPNETAASVKRAVHNHLDHFFAGRHADDPKFTDLCNYFLVDRA